ncbi:MAG TPA: HemK/PrmC family methyltransferase [Vitreimonas sp.]|nr:HemK/PrmC family methyltransferase [Vitreimonas sp.]
MPTVEELLRGGTERLRASGSESPRLDAELLLGHAIGADRTTVVAHPEVLVGEDAEARFKAGLERRAAGEPVAYVRGFKEFHGLAFSTDARALIPRPETERLVELAGAEVRRRLTEAPRPEGADPLRILDVGTGAGTVAVSLAVALRRRGIGREVEILATDDSPDALELARENAVGHSVGDRVRFLEADLVPPAVGGGWSLVLANLPYVRSDAIDGLPIAASFEPRHALDGGPDGLAVIARLLDRLPEALTQDGIALLEIGSDQGSAIGTLVGARLPGWRCGVEADLAGHPRVARVERP